MTCYIDLLWAVNFGMDALITALTGMILKKSIPPKRLFAGSAISSFAAVIFILSAPDAGINSYIYSIASLLPAVFISFRPSDIYSFLKQFFFLYLTSFLLGGFIYSLMLSRDFYTFPQSEVYSIKPILIFAFIFSALVFSAGKLLTAYISDRNLCCEVKVYFMGKTASGTGFIDTGNFLTDPLTGKPVIAANVHCVIGLFPEQMINDLINSKSPTDTEKAFSDCNLEHKFRIIPYIAFGEKTKYMAGFVSDFTEIVPAKGKTIVIQNLTIGITHEKFNLSTGSGFILNPKIFK